MRKPGLLERPLEKSLPAKVLKRGVLRRVGDADMDYPRDCCAARRLEEGARVVDCLRVPEVGMIEPHPVGVVQDLGTLEGARELLRVVEVERMYLDSIPERMLAIRRVGESSDAVASLEQPLGDVAAGVAEGARYYVQFAIISHRGPLLLPNAPLSGGATMARLQHRPLAVGRSNRMSGSLTPTVASPENTNHTP
jgi:hypothetical protein